MGLIENHDKRLVINFYYSKFFLVISFLKFFVIVYNDSLKKWACRNKHSRHSNSSRPQRENIGTKTNSYYYNSFK